MSEATPCKYGDPMCPCQDGDMCHYEGENPMTPPVVADRDRLISLLHRCFQLYVDKHDGECAGAMEQGEIGCSCGNDALMQEVGNAIGIELMDTPASEPVQPVAWMNPAANVFARHKEGADNFGCTVPLYAAPQGYVLVPVEPSQEYWDKAWAQIRCDGHITGSASVVQIKRMFDACHTAMLSAAKKGGE